MPRIAVIDLSHHNTVPNDLRPTKQAGVVGVIHKMTEGTSVVDEKADARRYLADDAGLLWGLYHFLRPGSMQQQADFFLYTAEEQGVLDDATLLACDYEDARVHLYDVQTFMEALEKLSGRSPVLYSGHVLKEQPPNPALARYRLWLAQYGSAPSMPVGWDKAWLWQYSDGEAGPEPHTVPGVKSPCDCNHYDGTDEELIAEWSGLLAPAPAPEPEHVTARYELVITAPAGPITVELRPIDSVE